MLRQGTGIHYLGSYCRWSGRKAGGSRDAAVACSADAGRRKPSIADLGKESGVAAMIVYVQAIKYLRTYHFCDTCAPVAESIIARHHETLASVILRPTKYVMYYLSRLWSLILNTCMDIQV